MYVCLCHGITERQLRQDIRIEGLASLADIAQYNGAGNCCGCCREELAIILTEERAVLVGTPLPGPVVLAARAVA